MTKRHFIALADRVRDWQVNAATEPYVFPALLPDHLGMLASFCESQNPRFNRQRWLDYIASVRGVHRAPGEHDALRARRALRNGCH